LDIVKLRTGRKRTDTEPFDTWRLGAGKLQESVGIDVVSVAVNKKGESIGRAMDNRNEREAACLVSERSQPSALFSGSYSFTYAAIRS
jgi:hypothetical protein